MNINPPSIAKPRCIGVLINPLSGRVRRQQARMCRLIHRLPRARVAQVRTPAEVETAIASWALMENDLLVVVGGDGTLQAALTSLLQTPGAKVPKVFIVPAGTTNMSANAIGLRGSPLRAIKALTRWLTHDDHTAREKPTAVLQVSDRTPGEHNAACSLARVQSSPAFAIFMNGFAPPASRGWQGH